MNLIFTFKTVGCRFTPAKLDPCFHLISCTGSFFHKYLTVAIMPMFVTVGIFHSFISLLKYLVPFIDILCDQIEIKLSMY